jgi:TP53 regulating kinase-like protein
VRCLKAGVRVPALRIVDVKSGALGVEWIEGWSVREVLGGGQEEDGLPEPDEGEAAKEQRDEELDADDEDIEELLGSKGVTQGRRPCLVSLDALLASLGD